jgi:hypothetical protein
MNAALAALAESLRLADPEREPLRLAFGAACAARVRHLILDPEALAALDVLDAWLAGRAERATLTAARDALAGIANCHRGSGLIDGSGNAAVSSTYAAAAAIAGRALDAAGYAAYAAVYAYGSYAVGDPSAYAGEHAWQVATLEDLARCADARG